MLCCLNPEEVYFYKLRKFELSSKTDRKWLLFIKNRKTKKRNQNNSFPVSTQYLCRMPGYFNFFQLE